MAFDSILFRNADDRTEGDAPEAPPFLADLNLDQILDAVMAGTGEHDLRSFFTSPLRDVETIRYRQEVMQDLEEPGLMQAIRTFCGRMIIVRRYLDLASNGHYYRHMQGWFLEAALVYCQAVTDLARGLRDAGLTSRGLLALRQSVAGYTDSERFRSFQEEAERVRGGLSDIRYSVMLQSARFSVRRYEAEADFSAEVERTFAKFAQGAGKDYLTKLPPASGMNPIEAQILDFVARLHPEQFAALDVFCQRHVGFVDPRLRAFDREIQFYIAYLDFIDSIRQKGLAFCYPEVTSTNRGVFAHDAFDLALARKLLYTDRPIVCNDFYLEGPERIIVVSGPNQGGKTTFARMFGQLHYLASLGLPVPGTSARLFLFDQMFAHFERQEDIRNLRGKLQDDMVRIHDILSRATRDSIILVNEVFASTTLEDAVFLSKAIMQKVMELDALCVWVTFLDELSSLSEKTVSMVSTVVPENPAVRTFKILRRPADGLAYALSIARKYRLTYEQIRERIGS